MVLGFRLYIPSSQCAAIVDGEDVRSAMCTSNSSLLFREETCQQEEKAITQSFVLLHKQEQFTQKVLE